MKLLDYEVRMNPITQCAELVLQVAVPLELIEQTDEMLEEESGRILGSYVLHIFNQIKNREST